MVLDWARRWVPRNVRMAVLHPRSSLTWLGETLADRAGLHVSCRMADDWTVRCTATSRDDFGLFMRKPAIAAELAAFRRHATPGMVLFDVGAHFGAFSLATLRYGGADARVVAVEPSTAAARVLKANLALNDATSRVTVHEAAVGAVDGSLEMLSAGAGGGQYFVAVHGPRPDAISIREYTLPSLAAASGLQPTHVKIDVEGYEGAVLDGAADWLEKQRPVVFLELHCEMLRSRKRDPRQVLGQLRDIGYVLLGADDGVLDADAAVQKNIVRLVAVFQ